MAQVRSLRGFARSGEVELDLVQIGPLIEQATRKLWPVVDTNAARFAALTGRTVELIDHLVGLEGRSRSTPKSLSRMAVDNRQYPERSAVENLFPSAPTGQEREPAPQEGHCGTRTRQIDPQGDGRFFEAEGLTTTQQRAAVVHARQKFATSERRTCNVLRFAHGTLRYQARPGMMSADN